MKRLKIAVIGAGSTYTPELIDGFIKRLRELPFTEIFLMDLDPVKLEIVGGLAGRMLRAAGHPASLALTGELEEAVRGADFVICQIRVGRLEARIKDERIPLRHDLIGQETTGAGGFMKALRSIPALRRIAAAMERLAPEAWLINFTNPAGLITEMLLNHCRVRAIGLCNGPIHMLEDALQRTPENWRAATEIEYVGLNHLSWVTRISHQGRDLLRDQLSGSFQLFRPANQPKIEFAPELLREVGAIPCSYLSYYYHRDQSLAHLKAAPQTRGELCREIEAELLELYRQPGLVEKPAVLEKRGGSKYSEVAVSLISAIHNDKNERHVVNVQNRGALPFMGDDDVVEVQCLVNRQGATPLPLPRFDNQHIIGMMQTLKSYEKLAVRAGLSGDRHLALQALLNHPLVGDYHRAKAVLGELLAAHREHLPQFFPAN